MGEETEGPEAIIEGDDDHSLLGEPGAILLKSGLLLVEPDCTLPSFNKFNISVKSSF